MSPNLGVMSYDTSIDGSNTVLEILHFIIPGLDGPTPGVLIAGHVQVLTTSTGYQPPSEKQMRERKERGKRPMETFL